MITTEAGIAELSEDSGEVLARTSHDVGGFQSSLEVLEWLSKAHDWTDALTYDHIRTNIAYASGQWRNDS